MSAHGDKSYVEMRKPLVIFIILFLISGCKSPKRIYNNVCIGVPKHFQEEVLKKNSAKDDNYTLLYFTENFSNDKIVVSNNNVILFENYISSVEGLGFASVTRIDNNFETDILYKNKNYHFKIEKNKYKFIYVSKTDKNRFIIKYSDSFCGFR